MTSRIIGGMFGLEGHDSAPSPCRAKPFFLGDGHVKLASARCAFTLLSQQLQPPTIWFPAYLCDVVLSTAVPGTRIRFFPINLALEIANDAWLSEVRPGDMVVFISYFGFDNWTSFGLAARQRGAIVVEDACQALLNENCSPAADFVIYSPRKFLGIPDGGILLSRSERQLGNYDLPAPDMNWWLKSLQASLQRGEYDRHGGERTWYSLFCKTEPVAPIQPTRMSELSAGLLENSIDYSVIAERRRENYRRLSDALDRFALFEAPSEGVAPLGFPVRLANREAIKHVLINNEIFPPVHWPTRTSIPAEFALSHQLADEMMTLPCDQRYTSNDTDRLIQCFLDAAPVAVDK